jgi:hypothetical protein
MAAVKGRYQGPLGQGPQTPPSHVEMTPVFGQTISVAGGHVQAHWPFRHVLRLPGSQASLASAVHASRPASAVPFPPDGPQPSKVASEPTMSTCLSMSMFYVRRRGPSKVPCASLDFALVFDTCLLMLFAVVTGVSARLPCPLLSSCRQRVGGLHRSQVSRGLTLRAAQKQRPMRTCSMRWLALQSCVTTV